MTTANQGMNVEEIKQIVALRVVNAIETITIYETKTRSSSPVRSTTPPPDYPFDKPIFAELDNSLWIIPQPLGSEPVPEKPNESDTF
ncbi:hypothetical protein Tco_1018014 [Tanacetum coccineum]|uniref:Uncharacterized protein n=1 Tax=Tanacetum coccineum TaxID=301880 RepID=A0ABQ5FTJ2_9ASTR